MPFECAVHDTTLYVQPKLRQECGAASLVVDSLIVLKEGGSLSTKKNIFGDANHDSKS